MPDLCFCEFVFFPDSKIVSYKPEVNYPCQTSVSDWSTSMNDFDELASSFYYGYFLIEINFQGIFMVAYKQKYTFIIRILEPSGLGWYP